MQRRDFLQFLTAAAGVLAGGRNFLPQQMAGPTISANAAEQLSLFAEEFGQFAALVRNHYGTALGAAPATATEAAEFAAAITGQNSVLAQHGLTSGEYLKYLHQRFGGLFFTGERGAHLVALKELMPPNYDATLLEQTLDAMQLPTHDLNALIAQQNTEHQMVVDAASQHFEAAAKKMLEEAQQKSSHASEHLHYVDLPNHITITRNVRPEKTTGEAVYQLTIPRPHGTAGRMASHPEWEDAVHTMEATIKKQWPSVRILNAHPKGGRLMLAAPPHSPEADWLKAQCERATTRSV
jgi:hypothetical protein